MASFTADSSVSERVPAYTSTTTNVRIEPPRAWLELRLREVWTYRELLYFFVWRDWKVRYKQTAVGVAWVVLQPLMSMGAFTLFFGRLAKLPSDGLPYPVFYFAALAPWTYFATALTKTTNIVVQSQNLITKVYFPRLILPISAVVSGLVDFVEHATTVDFVEGEETSQHYIVFPGTYLCRFEQNVSVLDASLDESPRPL